MVEAAHRDASTRNVVVIGSNNLQNRLLANLLDERVGCGCLLRSSEDLGEFCFDATKLALLDIDGMAAMDIIARLQVLAVRACSCYIAIMNADEDASLEQIIAWPGIRGIFFRQTSQENLIKGIEAIFNGECWLPRKILSARWEQTSGRRHSGPAELVRLTPKEIETLKLLAGGNSNDHIARKLNVSTHTVKTHVYNLFRKLHVSNRVQAVHWALQHIDGVERELR
jgi:LuxR family transcriptional regulator of csgAB operon